MSKQLTIAAALSVLMMSSFVLFGTRSVNLPRGLSFAAVPMHVGLVKTW